MSEPQMTPCRHNETGLEADIPTDALDGWQKLGWEPIGESRTPAEALIAELAAEIEVQEVADDVASLTIAQVLEEVGDDPEKAQAALDAELARPEPRTTLVARLTTKAGQTGDPEGN